MVSNDKLVELRPQLNCWSITNGSEACQFHLFPDVDVLHKSLDTKTSHAARIVYIHLKDRFRLELTSSASVDRWMLAIQRGIVET